MNNYATSIIILAAGSSSRLGLPKQLLQYKGKSLLRIISEKSLEVHPLEVIVVLGFESERMQCEIQDIPVRTILNPEWMEGIASSIRAGVKSVHAEADAVLICLCDQPGVTTVLLSQLVSSCSPDIPIAATEYNQILGVPACFDRSIFPELLLLQGDIGAKRVIAQDRSRVVTHSFPPAVIDIDTLEDYRNQG